MIVVVGAGVATAADWTGRTGRCVPGVNAVLVGFVCLQEVLVTKLLIAQLAVCFRIEDAEGSGTCRNGSRIRSVLT